MSENNHTATAKKLARGVTIHDTKDFEMVEDSFDNAPDLVCLSHLRWDFVFQRPQHLLTRCARERRVFFIEEPVFTNDQLAQLDLKMTDTGVCVVIPRLPKGLSGVEVDGALRLLIDDLFSECKIRDYLLWYYTPMALSFTSHLTPLGTVYDCMDELSAFKNAPPVMREREAELLKRADVVFTGGQSLYEAKCHQHPNIHPFPSSIDAAHFAQARTITTDPEDQAAIPHPRLGFFGVIDERLDIELLKGVAEARPDWHLVIIGPVVKIAPEDLPRCANIHYLGGKDYKELPAYLAGWDAALLPFARNEATRFISPTKTPEYLAAARPVVSTSIRDVVRPYGEKNLVKIADNVEEFVTACEAALRERDDREWLLEVDAFLAGTSWDQTWIEMMEQIERAINARNDSLEAQVSEFTAHKQPVHRTATGHINGD